MFIITIFIHTHDKRRVNDKGLISVRPITSEWFVSWYLLDQSRANNDYLVWVRPITSAWDEGCGRSLILTHRSKCIYSIFFFSLSLFTNVFLINWDAWHLWNFKYDFLLIAIHGYKELTRSSVKWHAISNNRLQIKFSKLDAIPMQLSH